MSRVNVVTSLGLAVLAAGLVLSTAQAQEKEESYSSAETLLFLTDHLQPITRPNILHYRFKKEGTLEAGFQDQVDVFVERVQPDGSKFVSAQFLTGEREKSFPPVENARGNPVLMYFLNRDILEMQRLTGGSWRYFKRLISQAFAESAEVRPVKLSFGGEELAGTEVKVTPYAADPKKERYQRFAGKVYVFVLAPKLPGGIYQIRTVVPGEAGGSSKPLIEETMTFSGAEALVKRSSSP
ncbi:hypothetical protein [Pelomicrobium sp.]|jgi:hypothetical protein|uniref:hypothetical protein n=1 Tax=Pelomicrobium sp. TaxID=2815319 RepID=UPI002FDCCEF3